MSDLFYRVVRLIGRHAFWVSSRPVVLGVEHVPRRGACVIASNHTSPYDVAILMRHTPRLLDFVSIVEVFKHPLLGWFYGNMNAFPLDRSKPDAPTVRTLLGRLERGRVVAMFPEGGFRRGEQSVLRNGKIRSGVGRLVRLAGVPLVPAVVINSIAYSKPAAWLPLRRVRYAVAFGPAISHELEAEEIEEKLVEAMAALYARASGELPAECRVV